MLISASAGWHISRINIFTGSGKLVKTLSYDGQSKIDLNIPGPAGNYTLHIENNTGGFERLTVIKL